MSRKRFMDALSGKGVGGSPAAGTGTSIACRELMEKAGAWFPGAHTDPEKMADLAAAGHELLGFDVVMPLFSVCHEAAAMGCRVNWGGPEAMPEARGPIFVTPEDIRVPADLLEREGCAVPLAALSLLRKRLGGKAAVCGKVFGPWTQAYHYFGVENFLMMALDDPPGVERIMESLLEVTVRFARAQLAAGADCLLLGDHATRDLCGPEMYRRFLLPVHRRLAREINAPLVLHICGDTSDRIGMIAETGLACFHYDTRTGPPEKVRAAAAGKIALMGGIDNYMLLRGRPGEIADAAAAAARAGIEIVGPECAVPLLTPLANLAAVPAALN